MHLKNTPSALIFIIATLIGGESQNNFNTPVEFRLSTSYFIPTHYNVKLVFIVVRDSPFYNTTDPILIPENNKFFSGNSSITVNILLSTRKISLHIQYVDSTLLSFTTLIKKDGSIYYPEKTTEETNMINLYFSDLLYPGLYKLNMPFLGNVSNDNAEGFLITTHKNEDADTSWVFASYTQTGARRLFPCLDNPQIRTTFTISVKHPHNSTALSNMPTHKYSIDDDDFKWTLFCTTPLLSTHHIAVAVKNNLNTVTNNYKFIFINTNISLWFNQRFKKDTFKFARQVIKNVTSYLVSVFEGIVIPKIDYVAIPNFPQDGASKWGLIFHREEDLIYDEDLDPIMRKIEVARFIAYKIAYQWFCNAVSPSRWSSFWLHDGLATIFGEEAIVKTFNNSEILDFFIVQNQYESLHLDSYYDMNPPQFNNVSEIVSLYSFPRYIKVPIVLRMLQNAVTDEVFRNSIQKYLYTYMFNSVTIDDFWSLQEDVFKKSNYNISKEFLNWIVYKHYPVLNWTQENTRFFYPVKLTQHFNTSYGKWWIPTSLMTNSSINKINLTLTEEKPYFRIIRNKLHNKDLIMVDIQQAGYYRVDYEGKWYKIYSHCRSQHFREMKSTINVINRAKMMDDSFHLMFERQPNSSLLFGGDTDYLWYTIVWNERDFVLWYPMFKMFEYMSNMIPFYEYPVENSIDINVKDKLSNLVNYTFKKLNLSTKVHDLPKKDFLLSLEEEILKWSCMFRHEQCLAMAKEELLHYLEDRSKVIPPGRRNWVYCNGLLTANASVWSRVKDRWLENNRDLLPYLACTQNSTIVVEYVPYILWDPTINATQDTAIVGSYINIFHSMISKHANDFIILTDILLNLDRMKPKEISTIVALTDIINHVCCEKHLIQIYVHTINHITDKQQFSKMERKIRTRSSQIENQRDYFKVLFDN